MTIPSQKKQVEELAKELFFISLSKDGLSPEDQEYYWNNAKSWNCYQRIAKHVIKMLITNNKIEKDTESVARLAEVLMPEDPYEAVPLAQLILNSGYIHFSRAVDMVAICSDCKGYGMRGTIKGQMPDTYEEGEFECPTCQGKGIVLKLNPPPGEIDG